MDGVYSSGLAAGAAQLKSTTDPYAIGGLTLYQLTAKTQRDGAFGTPLVTNVFPQTGKLMAMTHDDVTTIWTGNGSNEVYYLSCPTTQLPSPGAWSTPVPILCGVEQSRLA
ncbi:hypothetical protein F4779DRAFT_624049 [Xylariaceae sp. FL0662B]|nr:hypothetical protein F4779DRAFT_624049 [Xylariaceae sp. FL0662B]